MYRSSLCKAWVCSFTTLISALVCSGGFQKTSPGLLVEGRYRIRFSYTAKDLSSEESELWWGAGADQKHYHVLSRISGTYNGKRLTIAPSAWAGIAVVERARIVPLDNGCEVLISGSDAGAAYQMELTFQKDELIYRRVRLDEFPDEVWEQTFYKCNHGTS